MTTLLLLSAPTGASLLVLLAPHLTSSIGTGRYEDGDDQ
ncbi:hypothetical protein EDD29_0020 [Actinocorallia herbida]|nr:hypothetical protein EDD29_0020 [Actinocorallia herbida]